MVSFAFKGLRAPNKTKNGKIHCVFLYSLLPWQRCARRLLQFNQSRYIHVYMYVQSRCIHSWLFLIYKHHILKSVLPWSQVHKSGAKLYKILPEKGWQNIFCWNVPSDDNRGLSATDCVLHFRQMKIQFYSREAKISFISSLIHFLYGNPAALSSFRKELFQNWLVNGGQGRRLSE